MVIVPDNKGLCSELEKEGIAYRVVFYRYSIYPPLRTMKDKLLFVPRLFGRIYANCIGTRQICTIANEFKPDIIHTNVSVITIGLHAAKKLHIPHVWHIREYGDRDFDMHYYPTRRHHIRALHRPDSYSICITCDLAEYNELTHWPASKVIYNGIIPSSTALPSPERENKESFFLYAGRIEPAKGIYELIEAYLDAFPHMQEKHRLLLAGKIADTTYYRQIQHVIDLSGLQQEIVFLGEINNPDDYMRRTKAVIVPSISEGFGRIMPEAMINGALVIARDNAGSKEQLDNGLRLTGDEIGLRYTTRNELSMLLQQVADSGLAPYADMIARAHHTVCTLYTNEKYAQNILDFYKQILKQ